jgi:hypothetical protein
MARGQRKGDMLVTRDVMVEVGLPDPEDSTLRLQFR